MKNSFKYIFIIIITIFSFYYTDKVIELSEYNNVVLASINEYASVNDKECIEGSINKNGIILGLSGIKVDKDKSYSNMKGIGFKKELIEYKNEKCILNKEDNLDKYIIKGNNIENKISLIFDMYDLKYYETIENISRQEKIEINYLINYKNLEKIDSKNILYKTNINNIKKARKIINNFYCVKTNDYDIIKDCKKEKINSIKIINYIDNDLLLGVKKILNKGEIIFIKESYQNVNELLATIKYIKSRGYDVVSVDELL